MPATGRDQVWQKRLRSMDYTPQVHRQHMFVDRVVGLRHRSGGRDTGIVVHLVNDPEVAGDDTRILVNRLAV